ncbi:T7SS effector LXG polymorphic toxin [Bacillus atrophaeus]|uniref:T7SS effector LXG polymorphic toxin n=1 Tax=Bacillus atrophaeus TaxID=1452 RepID=UPI00399CB1F7
MHHLAKQKQQLKKLEKSVEHLAGMKDSLKGKGGDAIRTFYEECHKPFFAFLRHVYRRIQKSAETNAASGSSVESDSNDSKYTVKELLEEFLEDVKQIVLN